MTPSTRQQTVYDTWDATDSNMVIQAVAGSGKTTTLIELLSRCDARTLFLAFNKAIQEEIQSIIDTKGLAQGKAMTIHSLGLSAIRNVKKFKINNRKNFDIIKALQENNKRTFNDLTWEKKVSLSFTLMDFNDTSRIFMTDNMDEIIAHMAGMDKGYFEIDGLEDLWEEFIRLRQAYNSKPTLEIDFNDMIFLPIRLGMEIPVYATYLMVDEAQDLNLAQHMLLDKLIGQGTIKRFIAVGDTNQSIYGFSGAYSSSFDRFIAKPNTVELPLDICYRCPVSVIESANQIYDVMQPFKRDPGVVRTINSTDDLKEGSMVICRNSTPLLDLYFKLLGKEKKVYLKGEDILPAIKKFIKPYTYKSINVALSKLDLQLTELAQDKYGTDAQRMKYYWFKQQCENVRLLAKNLCGYGESVKDLLTKLELMFNDDTEGAITLCTIHKSKGLEANVVYILNEHLIPSKFARSDKQLKQEKNLKYVARTRAKEELYFLNI